MACWLAGVCLLQEAPLGDHGGVTFVTTDAAAAVEALRAEDGKDVWLFGGGAVASNLLAAGLVHVVEVTVVPVLLGAGIPFLATGALRIPLRLTDSRVYPSGVVTLRYDVRHATI